MTVMEKNKKEILKRVNQNKQEFAEFLTRYSVIQLAVGVVIGQAVKDLVSAIANNLIMPIVGALTPSGSWQSWTVTVFGVKFGLGGLIASFLDFLIVAVVVFVVLKKILKVDLDKKKK